ncbi:MAG: GGDEF domain-containing protein [Poseidonibacter sp.]
MQKISVSKELFEDILLKKLLIFTKQNNKYWKKILLEPKIIDDNIEYSIKQFESLTITNGLAKDAPLLVVECKKIDYSSSKDCFEFSLGKIIEQRNTNLEDNYKDNLIEELLREKELLKDQMNRDHLTKVYNRRKMEDDLKVFARQSNSSFLSAIFIDADRFKGINDNFGHEAGDKTLVYLATKLKKHADILNGEVYRYGGEEFLILCFITKKHIISKLNELREDIKSKKLYHPLRDISITVSMGVSFLSDCKDINEMIKKADAGVYRAKDNGRDRIEFM